MRSLYPAMSAGRDKSAAGLVQQSRRIKMRRLWKLHFYLSQTRTGMEIFGDKILSTLELRKIGTCGMYEDPKIC